MPAIKEEFEERHRKILGLDYENFKKVLLRPLPASFRINTLKISKEVLLERFKAYGWKLKEVPFYSDGLVFEGKKPVVLGNTLEHFLGYIYVQETASMIPPVVLEPKPGDTVLDLAAAPGSKTTQMAQMMSNEGVIVANEKLIRRLGSLRTNTQRCGVSNAILTCMDGRSFNKKGLKFDKVLLDAPCTATGAIMKSPYTLKTWSVAASQSLAGMQRQLLDAAVASLAEDGMLVYSTCSLEPEENELVVDYAVKKFGLNVDKVKLEGFKTRPGIAEWEGAELDPSVRNCLRIYPQDNNTEGFFVARLRA
jgi:NOL1/NOP2/sun family putative RNA methylase